MLVLNALPKVWTEPSASPFTVKAMCLLTMAGVAWRPDFNADLRKAPKAKLPVLIDGAAVIPDTSQIRAHLEMRHGADFDTGLESGTRRARMR